MTLPATSRVRLGCVLQQRQSVKSLYFTDDVTIVEFVPVRLNGDIRAFRLWVPQGRTKIQNFYFFVFSLMIDNCPSVCMYVVSTFKTCHCASYRPSTTRIAALDLLN